jgi:SAM-dependent methyltransferase
LCSSDYELPFKDHTVDVLCYFGILHHTKNKSDNIQKDKRVLRKKGHIILNESLDRPELRQFLPMFKAKGSTCEGFINKTKLLAQLEKSGSNVVSFKEEGTPFFAGMMALFNKAMLNNRKLFQLVLNLDILIAETLGRVLSFFRAGEILLLAEQFA